MKIKSIAIEINGEDKTLSLDEARELHRLLSEVLDNEKNSALKLLLEEARKHSREHQKEPVYIPMPYPVYPQPVWPPYRSPFWYGTTTTGIHTGSSGSASIKLLGCTVNQ